MKPAAEADWVAARTRYEQGGEPVAAIAAELGITTQSLTALARREGWKLRSPAKPRAPATRETLARLKNLLQQRLSDLEAQIDTLNEQATAATSERDIRAMETRAGAHAGEGAGQVRNARNEPQRAGSERPDATLMTPSVTRLRTSLRDCTGRSKQRAGETPVADTADPPGGASQS